MKYLQNNAFFGFTCTFAFVLGAIIIPTLIYWSLLHTEYAEGFQKSAWGTVKVGMAESEVMSLLGQPLSVSHWADQKVLSYSRSRSNSSYMGYYVTIQNDKVVMKIKEVWWD